MPELDPIAVIQGLVAGHGLAVNPRRRLGGKLVQDIPARGRLDLGMLTSHRCVTKDADLGALIQTEAASRTGQQIDAPFLASIVYLDPCAAQHLLNQGQAQSQTRAQDNDADGLTHVETIG